MHMFTHIILTIYPAFPKKWWTFQPFDLFMCRPVRTHVASPARPWLPWQPSPGVFARLWSLRNLDSWIVFMVSDRSWQYVWCCIQLTGDGDLILGIPPSCDSLWSYWPQLRGRGHKHFVSKSVIRCSWDIGTFFWDVWTWTRLEMFGDAALFSDPSLRCEAVACSKGSPGLEATDVQKEFLQLLQPFEEKKTWTTYHLGLRLWASLRLWQLRLLCETAVKLTIQAQNHAKASTGKTLWGHLGDWKTYSWHSWHNSCHILWPDF